MSERQFSASELLLYGSRPAGVYRRHEVRVLARMIHRERCRPDVERAKPRPEPITPQLERRVAKHRTSFHRRRRFSGEEIARIVELREGGATWAAIAAKMRRRIGSCYCVWMNAEQRLSGWRKKEAA